MRPNAHILTCTPTYSGDVCAAYAMCLALASSHCMAHNMILDPRFAPGFSLVEYGRNWLVSEFLKTKNATHMFWIDSDLFFQPDKIVAMVNLGLDVVAGVYTTKHETDPIYPYTALGPVKNGIQEADKVPGGFMCMSRRAVEAVVETCQWHEVVHNGETRLCPRFFDLYLEGHKLHGEDFIACARLRHAGFKIWVYPDVNFQHYGRRAWPANLAEQLKFEDKSKFVGQNNPDAWKKNETESLTHVIYKSADRDAGISASGDSGRDAAAELGAGSERSADSQPVSAG